MAPLMTHNFENKPVSRTVHYRKVTKPLLERQRRARINSSLEELKKELILHNNENESITKLEKADILELTVRHLNKLIKNGGNGVSDEKNDEEKFRSGFIFCAQEISRILATSVPRVDIQTGSSIMIHLGKTLNQAAFGSSNMFSKYCITPPSSPSSTGNVWRPW